MLRVSQGGDASQKPIDFSGALANWFSVNGATCVGLVVAVVVIGGLCYGGWYCYRRIQRQRRLRWLFEEKLRPRLEHEDDDPEDVAGRGSHKLRRIIRRVREEERRRLAFADEPVHPDSVRVVNEREKRLLGRKGDRDEAPTEARVEGQVEADSDGHQDCLGWRRPTFHA